MNHSLESSRKELYKDLLLERWKFRSRRSRRRLRSTKQTIKKSLKGLPLIAYARRQQRIDTLLHRDISSQIIKQFAEPNPLLNFITFKEVTS